jgi:hypothetical protein
MAKAAGKRGATGRRGPAGPAGRPGLRGLRGAKGRSGARGKVGTTGAAGLDSRGIIKALDAEVHGLYRELSDHLAHLQRVQRQLEEMRTAIRKLGTSIKE